MHAWLISFNSRKLDINYGNHWMKYLKKTCQKTIYIYVDENKSQYCLYEPCGLFQELWWAPSAASWQSASTNLWRWTQLYHRLYFRVRKITNAFEIPPLLNWWNFMFAMNYLVQVLKCKLNLVAVGRRNILPNSRKSKLPLPREIQLKTSKAYRSRFWDSFRLIENIYIQRFGTEAQQENSCIQTI